MGRRVTKDSGRKQRDGGSEGGRERGREEGNEGGREGGRDKNGENKRWEEREGGKTIHTVIIPVFLLYANVC